MTKKGGKLGNPNITEVGHETRFKKGHKPGPNAHRPLGSPSLSATIERLLNREINTADILDENKTKRVMPVRERVGMAVIAKALSGDIPAVREILDRLEGKTTTKVEVTGKDGEPLKTEQSISISAINERLREFIRDGEVDGDKTLP